MDSPPHRKNILGDFSEIGVARVDGKDGKPYWCAEFGKPMPEPQPGGSGLKPDQADQRGAVDREARTARGRSRLARAAEAVAADLARNKGKRTSPSAFDQIEGRSTRNSP